MQFHFASARLQILKLLQRHSNCVLEMREINTSFGTLCRREVEHKVSVNRLKDNTNWIQPQKMVPKFPDMPLFRVSKTARRGLSAGHFCQEIKARAGLYRLSDATVSSLPSYFPVQTAVAQCQLLVP